MKKIFIFINAVYIFLLACGSIFAVGERTITLGAGSTWQNAERRTSISEVRAIRPHPVLVLSSAPASSVTGYTSATGVLGSFVPMIESALDMSVSFDEREPSLFRDSKGHYRLVVPPALEAAGQSLARSGSGAALFGRSNMESGASANAAPLIIQPQSRNAMFSAGNRLGDFTIEFWLYPQNMENGEQVFSWVASKQLNGNFTAQRITCTASRNRFSWTFVNFFTSINGSNHKNLEFSGNTPVVPKRWSHHLIRFDAVTGLLEYLVDGRTEAIVYATATGRESSEVYLPVAGSNGSFLLGERFVGLMDEFRIHSVCAGRSGINRYTPTGGRIETRAVDLGENSSGVIRINAAGGRTSINGTSARSEYRQNGRFRFSDASEMHFFVRASENPYLLSNSTWTAFTPGEEITGVRGRYVQIAVDFYPSADGESSPYLEQINIIYMPGEPPLPPRNLVAVAQDGSVQLRWRHSPASNTAGYLVYYSSVRGELFGNDALQGASPIDAGITNSINIEGLKNGTLYYFRVAAYDRITGEVNLNVGEFSAEVTARPLAGLVP
ncbi:MAG: fibronectin type III domain-containing protein [Treponema sp.]|nr:fibronectin type III domain-containing protein [Treponema sp.]